jgi:hypothetical protein
MNNPPLAVGGSPLSSLPRSTVRFWTAGRPTCGRRCEMVESQKPSLRFTQSASSFFFHAALPTRNPYFACLASATVYVFLQE